MNALDNIFGKEALKRVPNLIPVLCVGLVSHLHVWNELEKIYLPDSPIRCTILFTSPEILDLKKYVKVTMPWEEDGLAYTTGVPPHSIMLAQIEQLKHMIKAQPCEIEMMMDDRVMSGVLSENRMRELISNEREKLMGKINVLTEIFKKQSCSAVQVQTEANGVNDDGYQYWVVNGIKQKVPPDWTFPNGPIVNVYKYWHHSDANHGIAPLKKFVRSDLTQFDNI
ncbi:hypothetical protein CTEN210_06982 [Chaetoceros tenuissimus]|uniref:Uncharacterized protein n=1 Tax=Chaetoceros tenuissimus TaxID=426638 RepID=A0AAD3H502_9STRA|nr:hypothetical protein CTEN210_06982 [Chaetoceros tenuissimus]